MKPTEVQPCIFERAKPPRTQPASSYAPAFLAKASAAFASGKMRFTDSIACALAAVPSRMRPAKIGRAHV